MYRSCADHQSSLYATFLRNRIIGALRADPGTQGAAHHVSQNFVFEHPTLQDLAIAISILVGADVHEGAKSLEDAIRAMIEKYSMTPSRPLNGRPRKGASMGNPCSSTVH